MVYKMITSKSIIAKVIADLGLEEDKIKISDFTEWIGEAMQKIGSVNQKHRKVTILDLIDYQCKLPCDLDSIDLVAYSTDKKAWQVMKKTTGSFGVENKIDVNKQVYDLGQSNIVQEEDGDNILAESGTSQILGIYTQRVTSKQKNDLIQYDIKPGYIISNVRNGYVKLSYFAEYTDEEGIPMIPDIASYSEAIYWYIAMKLLYIEYFTGRKPQHLYYDAKRSWNFYRQQAYAESLMPDTNEIENIKNTWHTLIPERDCIDNFFYNMSDEQLIYKH